MNCKIKYDNLQDYLDSLQGRDKEMMFYFVDYMRNNHSDIKEGFSFQMPTYILGTGKTKNYISFAVNKNHFSLHSLDFEYISLLKEQLTKAGNGKGCVKISYDDENERKILIDGIEEIIKRQIYR